MKALQAKLSESVAISVPVTQHVYLVISFLVAGKLKQIRTIILLPPMLIPTTLAWLYIGGSTIFFLTRRPFHIVPSLKF